MSGVVMPASLLSCVFYRLFVARARIAVALLSLALALAVMSWKVTRFQVALAISSGLLAGLSTALRYAYWPLVVVIPMIVAYYALRYDRRHIRLAVANALAAGAIFGTV